MTQRNVIIEDNAITDEKTLLVKLEEEKKTVDKLNEHLFQKQEEKKALTSKLRNFTHKIKDLEEAVTINSMELEKLKMEREKFISKIDRKEINQKIDNKCELVFQDLLEQVDPQNMEIEVRFEGTSTHFRVSDNIDNPQESLKMDEPIFTKPIRKDSLTKKTSQAILQTKQQIPEVKPKTFSDLKLSVAPFFSLSPDDFFFADEQNAIFLDNLPIRQTLMPYGLKIKNTLPFLTIVLANHYRFDEIINEKIMKEAENYSSHNKKNKEESREMIEMELAKKQAEETRIKSEEYQNSRAKFQKIKGVLNSIIFLVVIGLYIFNLFQRFSFDKIYTMQNAIESALNDDSYASFDQQTFYTVLIKGMTDTSATSSQYAFFKLNYILKHITVVMTKYDSVSCAAESDYITTHNVKCLDPNHMDEAPYTTSGGVTYNYIKNPPDSVGLDVPLGHFDNSGYRLKVELSLDQTTYEGYYNQIEDFVDYSRGRYISFNFVVYNPSLDKMACVYRIFVRYNQDIAYFQNFIYVFNTQDRTTGEIVSANFLLALASILIIFSVLELFHIVHESKEEFDLELYFRDLKKKKGTTTLSKEDEDFILKRNFWTFRSFSYIIKFYPPGFNYLLNLLTVVLILVSGALDLSLDNKVRESGYLENSEVNCAPLIKSNFANNIISSILILLLVLVLLKYISLFVPFLARFVRTIQSLISNVYTIGIIILVMILMLAVFATYTFRPYFLDFTKFQQFYIALILMILKRNLILLNGTADAQYTHMADNIGTYAFVILILFLYVMLGLLIFKVITAIVIKSMKETQTDMKNEVNMSKAIHEKALNVMKEKLYEELKANLRKQKVSGKK